MSKNNSTIWEIEPHTEAKHEILEKYLNAWLPIMTRWNGRILYIDGFSGPGEYKGGEIGSPIIAIDSFINHKANIDADIYMLFIEAREDRCKFLKQKIESIPKPNNIKIFVECNEFQKVMEATLDKVDRLIPSFVFIDPFGFKGIPLGLIKKIMQNSKCEVLITFMYDEINRFISIKNNEKYLNETFGTENWKKIPAEGPKERMKFLHNLYKKQLKEVAGIKFVRSFNMVNKFNKLDYFLFFGTNNLKGLEKMKEAMWRVDESGAFNFSDATYSPLQPMLFAKKPNYYRLKQIILKEFKGGSVTVEGLENFILTKTSFLRTHYKTYILRKMEKSNPPEIERKCKQCKCKSICKHKKTYFKEKNCIIHFF